MVHSILLALIANILPVQPEQVEEVVLDEEVAYLEDELLQSEEIVFSDEIICEEEEN